MLKLVMLVGTVQLAIADTCVKRTLWGQLVPVSSTWNAVYEPIA